VPLLSSPPTSQRPADLLLRGRMRLLGCPSKTTKRRSTERRTKLRGLVLTSTQSPLPCLQGDPRLCVQSAGALRLCRHERAYPRGMLSGDFLAASPPLLYCLYFGVLKRSFFFQASSPNSMYLHLFFVFFCIRLFSFTLS
jgi:hypothetical protein